MLRSESGNLDVLRAVAVLLVLWSHTASVIGSGILPGSGHLGVLLFFIHTSYVLMMSMDRLALSGSVTARFYVRRIFRIYPLAITVILFVTALKIPVYMGAPYAWHGIRNLVMNMALMNNVGNVMVVSSPLWSLSYEVQMYLLLPVLYFALIGKRPLAGIWLIMGGIAAAELEKKFLSPSPYHSLFEYAPWFCAGIAAWIIQKRYGRAWPAWLYVSSLAAFIIAPAVAARAFGYSGPWVALSIGMAFAMALPRFREINSAGVRRAAHQIAKYSYGIYLSHVPILWFVSDRLSGPVAVRVACGLLLLCVVPVCLYHLIEEPLIRAGSCVADRMSTSRSMSAAAA